VSIRGYTHYAHTAKLLAVLILTGPVGIFTEERTSSVLNPRPLALFSTALRSEMQGERSSADLRARLLSACGF